jgi:uncharacterized protein (TIGR02145 family)
MKKLLICLLALSTLIDVSSQAPNKMSYQCVVRNTSGSLITNTAIGLRISILKGSPTGDVIFQETYNPNPQTNANGLLTIEIGSGVVIIGDQFSNIDWSSGIYFLKTETDPTGGTNYSITGTSQLLSVPYSLFAKETGYALAGSFDGLTNKPTTLSGYGITDGLSTSHPSSSITSDLIGNWNGAYLWGNHAGLYRPISYVPVWSEIASKPTTIGGYGITDAVAIFGDQNIAGTKTYTGKVKVPTPTENDDAAHKAYVDALKQKVESLEATLSLQGITIPLETITDADNNIYRVVTIGTQKWMGENLKTTKYNDGTPIPLEEDSWINPQRPAYCWYLNSEAGFKVPYGALYTWFTVNTGKLCPSGWHVPTQDDWSTLYNYLGDVDYKGAQLREVGTLHWNEFLPARATNETGFSAVGSGNRHGVDGSYDQLGNMCELWSADEYVGDPTMANYVYISNNCVFSIGGNNRKTMGYSVRCVMD